MKVTREGERAERKIPGGGKVSKGKFLVGKELRGNSWWGGSCGGISWWRGGLSWLEWGDGEEAEFLIGEAPLDILGRGRE